MAGPYYVDSTGGLDSNPGTQALPWQTTTKVNATVAAGETVYYMQGRTFNGQITPGANNIMYGAYGSGARPIINGSAATQCLFANSRNGIVIQDLRFTAGGTYGITADNANGLMITNCEVDLANSSGIILGNGTQFVTISNCLIHNNGGGGSGDRDGIGIGGGGAAPHDITIQGCDIYANWHDGVRVSMTSGLNMPNNVTIKNNTVRDSTNGGGVVSDACTNLTVQYNVITNNAAGVGIYVVPTSAGAVENVQGVIYHNTVVGNLWGMLVTNGGGGTFNVNVRNNLFQNNGVSGSSAEMGINSLTTYVGNYNLCWHTAGGNFMWGTSFMSFATWKTTVSPQEANSINSNPNLNADYTLPVGSPALSAGTFISGVSTTNPANIGARDVSTVAIPTVNNPAGSYPGSVTVTISDATAGATMCYRTDGVDPTATVAGTCSAGSTTYTVPVVISSNATLKVLGTKAANVNSAVLSQSYVITAAGAAGGGYGPWITNSGIGDNMADVSKQRITTVTSATLKATPGQFYGLMIGAMAAGGVVEVFDAATATGTPVLMITAPGTLLHNQCAFVLPHPIRMAVGITVRTTVAAQDVTVLWN